jgi:hypothetical protein
MMYVLNAVVSVLNECPRDEFDTYEDTITLGVADTYEKAVAAKNHFESQDLVSAYKSAVLYGAVKSVDLEIKCVGMNNFTFPGMEVFGMDCPF